MNRPLTDVNSACLGVQQKEEISHRYVLGLYDILERITEKYPDVLVVRDLIRECCIMCRRIGQVTIQMHLTVRRSKEGIAFYIRR